MSQYASLGTVGKAKLPLNPSALLSGHLLAVASSGGGKSWLIRLLLEQTWGHFPHLVIDPEGELRTLREKYDYIIASADDDGDCPAHPSSASLLATKLVELNASCIIDIYELSIDQQVIFVREFTKALIAVPKKLWGPRLVVIDEAHLFAPEKAGEGQASRRAVVDLLSRGRKRGMGVVLASQRIAKLSKDAMSECRSKAYGFCNLLADRKRATDDLGFIGKTDQEKFRKLDVGQFYVVGPALSPQEVVLMKAGKVKTTHPKPGEVYVSYSDPKGKVKKLLAELQDLPARAREEAKTLAEAQGRIKELEREQRRHPIAKDHEYTKGAVKTARNEGYAEGHVVATKALEELRGNYLAVIDNTMRRLRDVDNTARNVTQHTRAISSQIHAHETAVSRRLKELAKAPKTLKPLIKHSLGVFDAPIVSSAAIHDDVTVVPRGNGTQDYSGITGGARRLVEVLVRCHPAQFTKAQWGTLAKLRHTGGSFGTYLSKIRGAGLVVEDHGLFGASPEAFDWLGQPGVPENNEAVVEMWIRAIGGTPGKMIRILRDRHPEPITRDDLASEVGMAPTGGSFGTYLSKLRSNKLVEVQGQELLARGALLWEPMIVGRSR